MKLKREPFNHRAFLVAQLVKNLSAMQETLVWFLGRKDALEKGYLPTPVFLGFSGGSDSEESACNVETWALSLGWEDRLEEGMAIHSSIFTWRMPWKEEPGGLQSIGLPRVRHDWSDLTHTHTPSDKSSHFIIKASDKLVWLFFLISKY